MAGNRRGDDGGRQYSASGARKTIHNWLCWPIAGAGVRHFPHLGFKMNAAELAMISGTTSNNAAAGDMAEVKARATELAATTGQPVFVTLSENGIVGALPGRRPSMFRRIRCAARSISSAPEIR